MLAWFCSLGMDNRFTLYLNLNHIPVGNTIAIHNMIGSFQKSWTLTLAWPRQNDIKLRRPSKIVVCRCFRPLPNTSQICSRVRGKKLKRVIFCTWRITKELCVVTSCLPDAVLAEEVPNLSRIRNTSLGLGLAAGTGLSSLTGYVIFLMRLITFRCVEYSSKEQAPQGIRYTMDCW